MGVAAQKGEGKGPVGRERAFLCPGGVLCSTVGVSGLGCSKGSCNHKSLLRQWTVDAGCGFVDWAGKEALNS